ncbi:DNA primase [Candidatus Phytoplasma ziziphi]|uniref:DNA primase n=1 Tax=Ziziphus jujuba witches'-broom phytoplasma TaxID=135727 RepID=A0A660HM72_ZIZJU|nr:DNA primase [Candidatus Phytoplasma ziziphi]AYJ01133.1 DNA primase [Candidatus Phytoplasma ziziphi]
MNNVNNNLFEILNKKILIYDLIIKMGIVAKKQGKGFFALCPFHKEKTPSLSISPEKNIALCMGCRKGGSPVKFYSQLKDIPTSEAIQQLAKLFNINLPKQKLKPEDPLISILKSANEFYQKALLFILDRKEFSEHPLLKYLFEDRKLNKELIKEFGLGYSHKNTSALIKHLVGKLNYKYEDILKLGLISKKNDSDKYFDFFINRLMFPLIDLNGEIVGFCGRSLENNQNQTQFNIPKYLFNGHCKKENLLYRFFEHQKDIQNKKEVILCEGFFDVIAFYKIGMKNVVASLGTNLNRIQIASLKKVTQNVTVALDSDNAGKEAEKKISFLLNKNSFRVKVLHLPYNLDPDEYILSKQNNISLLKQKLEERTKDYIFNQIEEFRRKELRDNQINSNIQILLKYHNRDNLEYFRNKINEKYQIQTDLFSFISIKDTNNELLQRKKDKISLKGIIGSYEKEISILTELFLNQKYIDLVIEEIYKYENINADVIDLIRKIKDYSMKYSKEEEKKNGINISNFKNVYKEFLDHMSNSEIVYNLLLQVENNAIFKQKKRIKSQEYLKDIFIPFQMKDYSTIQQEIKKEIQIIKAKINEKNNNDEDYSPEINKLWDELKQKEKQLLNIQQNKFENKID